MKTVHLYFANQATALKVPVSTGDVPAVHARMITATGGGDAWWIIPAQPGGVETRINLLNVLYYAIA